MKREIHSNHRLSVTPAASDMYLRGQHNTRALLDDMAAAVRRHVDHVGSVKVEYDTRAVCSFCGSEWEVLSADDLATGDYPGWLVGEPMCCDRAAAVFRTAQAPDTTGGA